MKEKDEIIEKINDITSTCAALNKISPIIRKEDGDDASGLPDALENGAYNLNAVKTALEWVIEDSNTDDTFKSAIKMIMNNPKFPYDGEMPDPK